MALVLFTEEWFLVTDDGNTVFIQREKFKGILIPFLWKKLNKDTRNGFELMNHELKVRVESLN